MNTKEKYYTPTIEEFHVGFEFESYSDIDGWKDSVLSFPYIPFLQQTKIGEFVVPNWIRVKHLDQEDIESLGFVVSSGFYEHGDVQQNFWHEQTLTLLSVYNNGAIRIAGGVNDAPKFLFFHGQLKNKSELKRLMGQLGIL